MRNENSPKAGSWPQDTRGSRRALRAALLLAGLLPLPAGASQFRIEFEDHSADLMTTAFERGEANARLTDEIVRSEGYGLLFLHNAGTYASTPDAVRSDFRNALESALDGNREPGFDLQLIQSRPRRYRETLREFRRVAGTMRWRITDRLNEYLPPSSGFQSTAHLVVGGSASGMAFGNRDDIALRLDDFVPAREGDALDTDRLTSVLTHELFHVGFRAAGGFPPRPESPDRIWAELALEYGTEVVGEVWRASGLRHWDGPGMAQRFDAWVTPPAMERQALNQFVAMMARLHTEGCAVYVDAPLRDPGTTRLHEGEVSRWMENIDGDFAFLAVITKQLVRGATAEEIARLAAQGFQDNGPLYRVGYRMAKRIDNYGGRRPLLGTISGGPLEFFETYFDTHPYGPGQIDSATESEIRQLIREIRAVGAFDPEE